MRKELTDDRFSIINFSCLCPSPSFGVTLGWLTCQGSDHGHKNCCTYNASCPELWKDIQTCFLLESLHVFLFSYLPANSASTFLLSFLPLFLHFYVYLQHNPQFSGVLLTSRLESQSGLDTTESCVLTLDLLLARPPDVGQSIKVIFKATNKRVATVKKLRNQKLC